MSIATTFFVILNFVKFDWVWYLFIYYIIIHCTLIFFLMSVSILGWILSHYGWSLILMSFMIFLLSHGYLIAVLLILEVFGKNILALAFNVLPRVSSVLYSITWLFTIISFSDHISLILRLRQFFSLCWISIAIYLTLAWKLPVNEILSLSLYC